MSKVLVIDEETEFRAWLGHHVTAIWPRIEIDGCEPAELELLLQDFRPQEYQAILLSLRPAKQDSAVDADDFHWLERFAARPQCPPVIVVAEGGNELHAVKAMRLGASDYLPRRLLTHELLTEALHQALRTKEQAQEKALWRGKKIPELGDYKIIRPIARSKYASVYLALSEKVGERVAVKVMERPAEADDQRTFQRFEREYSVTAHIGSPRIADIYEYGSTEECGYIAMEYFDKGDLKARLSKPLLPRHCVRYANEIAEALEVIHSAGVLHRDLKPANVMLRGDNSLALIDFGLARFTDGTRLTHANEIKGTPDYMSPEQAIGDDVDERSDLYSLGAIFYEMLTGEKPYSGANAIEVLAKHRTGPVPKLPETLVRFQPLLDKLMAKDRLERFQSAAEFLEALRGYNPYVAKDAQEQEVS